MIRYVYVSHGWLNGGSTRTDFDALGAMAIMRRGAELRGLKEGEDFALDLIDYYNDGLDALCRWRDCVILVTDVPPEALARPDRPETADRLERTLRAIREAGNSLVLVDHHSLEPASRERFTNWMAEGLFTDLDLCDMDQGMDLRRTHHQKRCAAEMMRDWLRRTWGLQADPVIDEIARLAHDQDFGVRNIPGANRISAIIGADFPPFEIVGALSRGEFWNARFETAWEREEEDTARQIRQLVCDWRKWRFGNGREMNVVYALMPPNDVLKVTPAGIHCLDTLGADIAVLVQRRSFISMRVRYHYNDFHAGRILSAFGGGGHVGAASAGGRAGELPYGDAHESNFGDVVRALDRALAERGACESLPITSRMPATTAA